MSTDPASPSNPESRLVWISLNVIRPSPENEQLYRPVDPNDPAVIALAESIANHGVKEPLVLTKDRYILSGHRRYVACQAAGLDVVPCRIEPIRHEDPEFLVLLRQYNQQRVKSFDEIMREQVVDFSASASDPEQAYEAVLEHRAAKAAVSGHFLRIQGVKHRAMIGPAKLPMLGAAQEILDEERAFLPTSDRSIHYSMLNKTPLRHASKPNSRYTNDRRSYQDVCDLLTRARLAGSISFDAIADPTRTVAVWSLDSEVGSFLKREFDGLLTGYWRDLQQSQPNHIEIVGEKNTIEGSIRPVAMKYCIPYTLGRGYCSIDPRYKLGERFRQSGKEQLIILVMSDFDPEGEDIVHSFARSMRDDFEISGVKCRKVCLTYEQVKERNLPQTFDIKKGSSRYRKFAAKYGDRAHELEALPSAERSRLLEEAILSVLDIDAYNEEVKAEKQDQLRLRQFREKVGPALWAAWNGNPDKSGF